MLLQKCQKCKKYTLNKTCQACNSLTISSHPPNFSLDKEKKYGKYRRMEKAKV